MKSSLRILILLLTGAASSTSTAYAELNPIDLPGESESYTWSLNRANYTPEDFESADDWQAFSTNQPQETSVFVSKIGSNFIFPIEDSADGLYGRNGGIVLNDTAPPEELETIVLQLDYRQIGSSPFKPGSQHLAPILKVGGIPPGGDGRADTFQGNDTLVTSAFPNAFPFVLVDAGHYSWQWDVRGLDLSAGYTIEWATPADGVLHNGNDYSEVALLTGIRLDQGTTYAPVVTGAATYAIPEELPERDIMGHLPAPTGNPNLFENGSFETLTPYLEYLLENADNHEAEVPATDPTDPGTAYMPGWVMPTPGVDLIQPPETSSQQATDGHNYIRLGTYKDQYGRTSTSRIYAYVWLEAGVTYRFSFDTLSPIDYGFHIYSPNYGNSSYSFSVNSVNTGSDANYSISYQFISLNQLCRVDETLGVRNPDGTGTRLLDKRSEIYLADNFDGDGWTTRWAEFTLPVSGQYRIQIGPSITVDNFNLSVVSGANLHLREQWRLDHFDYYTNLGAAADNADPDGDGLSNLLEYALRRDPLAAEAEESLSLDQTDGVDKRLTVSFDRRNDPDLIYTVEASDNLEFGTWDAIFHSTDPSTLDTTDADSFVVEDSAALEPGEKRFFRLSVKNTDE